MNYIVDEKTGMLHTKACADSNSVPAGQRKHYEKIENAKYTSKHSCVNRG